MKTTLLHPDEQTRQRCRTRRLYPRVPFEHGVKFMLCSHNAVRGLNEGLAANVSQAGMLFSSKVLPPISSLILLETHLTDLKKCIYVDHLLLTSSYHILAKVVQVHHRKNSDLFDVGIAFIQKVEYARSDVQEALDRMPLH